MAAPSELDISLQQLNIKLANQGSDKKEIGQLLNYILCYPSLAQAHVHHRAANMGSNDLKFTQEELQRKLKEKQQMEKAIKRLQKDILRKKEQINSQKGLQERERLHGDIQRNRQEIDRIMKQLSKEKIVIQACPCCGLMTMNEELPFSTNMDSLNLGVGIYLYFKNYMFNVLVFLLMFAIYSIFALVTNIKVFDDLNQSKVLCILSSSTNGGCGLSPLGAGSKVLNQNDYTNRFSQIQSWLGIAFVILWGLLYIVKTHREQVLIFQMEEKVISASHFTLMITHVPRSFLIDPTKQISKKINGQEKSMRSRQGNGKRSKYEEVKSSLDVELSPVQLKEKFDAKFRQFQKVVGSPIDYTVLKVNVAKPLYDKKQQDAAIEKRLSQDRQKILVRFREWIYQRQRATKFKLPSPERNKLYEEYEKFCEYSLQREEERNVNLAEDNVVFVTFKYSEAMREIAKLYRPASIRNFWNLCSEKKDFFIDGVKIRRAPYPEEIKWQCVGFPLSKKRCRRFLMWMLTLVLIGISLGISIGIAFINKDSINIGVSIGISIVVTIFNIGIQIVIAHSSFYENQYVSSREQSITALKIGLGQLVNSIGVPIIVTLISRSGGTTMQRKSWLLSGGLVDDVFFIAAINALVPLGNLLDPWEMYLRVKRWWYSKPENRLKIYGQANFNKYFGNYNFDIGYEYAYLIKTAVFTSFFVAMQPIIAIFAPIGLALYYVVTKRNLYYHFQRPSFQSPTINTSVDVMLLMSPIAFGFGCLLVNNFIEDELNRLSNGTLLTNWIIVMIAVGFFVVVPLKIFYCCIPRPKPPQFDFEARQALMSTDYDRLNPETKVKALAEFNYILDKLEEGPQLLKVTVRNQVQMETMEHKHQMDMQVSKLRNSRAVMEQGEPQYNTSLDEYKKIVQESKPDEKQRLGSAQSNKSQDNL